MSVIESIDLRLDSFLERNITIPRSARSAAASSRAYLRQVMANKASADSSFPRLLTKRDSDFSAGSFERHTKVWPLDDIDLYFPIDGAQLGWLIGGRVQPYAVQSDDPGKSQPLLTSRWSENGFVMPKLLINGLRDALKETYQRSEVSRDGHGVNVQLTLEATSESDGIAFDVIPCFSLIRAQDSGLVYVMPDGRGSWTFTNPKIDTELNKALHELHNGTYRKAIRLVKFWNKHEFAGRLGSYFIELAICKRFLALNTGDWVSSNSRALALAFEGVSNAVKLGSLTSFVPEAPPVRAPSLTAENLFALETAKLIAGAAYHAAVLESYATTGQYLVSLFGVGF